ncbi:MAG: LacI family DNA-binding transcriptional regulator [Armatimonadota bacterium]
MRATVKDIAKAARVSRTTVLRALWDRPGIRPNTKARILKIASDMHYRPNHIARSLVLGRSKSVGFIASSIGLPGLEMFTEQLSKDLQEAEYSILLNVTSAYPGGERACVERLIDDRVAGVIAVPSAEECDAEIYGSLESAGVKLILVDKCTDALNVPQITGDHYSAALLATEYLISLGHKDIAHLAICESSLSGSERDRGFRDAMNRAGLPVNPGSIIETEPDDSSGFLAMQSLLRRKAPPTAVLARNDYVARGAMRAAYARGLAVPGFISIVGNGDIPGCDVLWSPLTTVRFPVREVASQAVKMLLDLLQDRYVDPGITLMNVDLVVRSSTAPPRSQA